MTPEDLSFFRTWFSSYCRSFSWDDEEDRKNMALKEKHTANVCSDIVRIARTLSLKENDLLLAETIALFHDVGRFRQYAEYKTFRDGISVNHGLLGAEILMREGVLIRISEEEQELLLRCVKYHNAFTIPDMEGEKTLLFLKLIRDADKLDIWRVFVEYYEGSPEERASAAGLGLPDIPEYSKEILAHLFQKKVAALSGLKTLSDFKLLQLSWIYDLNLPASFRFLLERDYINRIFAQLPATDELGKASRILHEYARKKSDRGD